VFAATMGSPLAIACANTIPNVSTSEWKTNTSADAKYSDRRSLPM
jgi:hypothetical protein